MKKVNLILAMGFISASAFIASCAKESTSSIADVQVKNAQDNAIAITSFENVDLSTASSALKADIVDSTDIDSLPPCKITHMGKGKIEKEFNFDGYSHGGKGHSGKIQQTITYPIDSTKEEGKVEKMHFDNFKQGGRKLEGTKTITYLGKPDGIHSEWEVKLDSGKITLKNGVVVTFSYDIIRKQIAGDSTLTKKDDVFEINGTGSGVNRKGIAYTVTTTNLIKANDCRYFKSGTVTYVSDKTIVTNYNSGDNCEPSATITVDGVVQTINIDIEKN